MIQVGVDEGGDHAAAEGDGDGIFGCGREGIIFSLSKEVVAVIVVVVMGDGGYNL